jgi:hypothetical protein
MRAHAFISVAKIVDSIAVACFYVKFPGVPPQSVLLLLLSLLLLALIVSSDLPIFGLRSQSKHFQLWRSQICFLGGRSCFGC